MMKKLAVAAILFFAFAGPAMPVELRLSGSSPSAHSAASGECLEDAYALGVAIESTIAKGGAFRMDYGAGIDLYKFTARQRENVHDNGGRERDEFGLGLYPYIKPTVRVWRVEGYVSAGPGADYQSTEDGLDLGVFYRTGVDVEALKGVYVGIYQGEVLRMDGGEYRTSIGFNLKFSL